MRRFMKFGLSLAIAAATLAATWTLALADLGVATVPPTTKEVIVQQATNIPVPIYNTDTNPVTVSLAVQTFRMGQPRGAFVDLPGLYTIPGKSGTTLGKAIINIPVTAPDVGDWSVVVTPTGAPLYAKPAIQGVRAVTSPTAIITLNRLTAGGNHAAGSTFNIECEGLNWGRADGTVSLKFKYLAGDRAGSGVLGDDGDVITETILPGSTTITVPALGKKAFTITGIVAPTYSFDTTLRVYVSRDNGATWGWISDASIAAK